MLRGLWNSTTTRIGNCACCPGSSEASQKRPSLTSLLDRSPKRYTFQYRCLRLLYFLRHGSSASYIYIVARPQSTEQAGSYLGVDRQQLLMIFPVSHLASSSRVPSSVSNGFVVAAAASLDAPSTLLFPDISTVVSDAPAELSAFLEKCRTVRCLHHNSAEDASEDQQMR